jgi:hypothetical protein
MKKFKVQEEEIAAQELRHKQTLYEVERKFITGKDKYVCEWQKYLDSVLFFLTALSIVYCFLLFITV